VTDSRYNKYMHGDSDLTHYNSVASKTYL
jgi:hypothetical protein